MFRREEGVAEAGRERRKGGNRGKAMEKTDAVSWVFWYTQPFTQFPLVLPIHLFVTLLHIHLYFNVLPYMLSSPQKRRI